MEIYEENISGLKVVCGESTGMMLLLGSVTMGAYFLIWLLERYKIFNNIAKTTIIERSIIVWIAVLIGVSGLLASMATNINSGGLSLVSSLIGLSAFIIYIVMSFRIAKAMDLFYLERFGISLSFNKVYLVIFNFYYINYCINELAEIEQKENIKKARA